MEHAAEIRAHLFSLAARGIKYDLERMAKAASRCGNPQNTYPSFHIAGTNGKGSTCVYLESALRHCGIKTGLFMSPHLVNFEERFMVNGRPIAEATWLAVYHDLQSIIEEFAFTFFEATTLMAFEIFKRENVEWVVFETGLGGRLDATNVVVPRVSVITRIAMDHIEYLGNNIMSIAAEKLGIAKKGVPLVMARPAEEEVRALAKSRCRDLGSACTFVSEDEADAYTFDAEGAEFRRQGENYRVNLRGDFQISNAVTALHALTVAGFRDHRRIAEGLRSARLPGRFHVESIRNRTVVFDVGHNPNAAEAFCSSLQSRFKGKTVCFVLGIMKDKDSAGMLAQYARAARRFIFTAPATERAATPEVLRAAVPAGFSGECRTSPNVGAAVEMAFEGREEIICIAGSFFTVGEGMLRLGIEPYQGVLPFSK
jgi:dihydrofolate synthase/folylpolyglutamate synthase